MTNQDTDAAYCALHAAADGLVREIVELHKPVPVGVYKAPDVVAQRLADGTIVAWWECKGCEFDGYDGDPPEWPCETTRLIAQHVGVNL